jgi:hypothetical protein
LADAITKPQEFTLFDGCCAEHTQKVVYAELQGHGWLGDQGLRVAANRIAIKVIDSQSLVYRKTTTEAAPLALKRRVGRRYPQLARAFGET